MLGIAEAPGHALCHMRGVAGEQRLLWRAAAACYHSVGIALGADMPAVRDGSRQSWFLIYLLENFCCIVACGFSSGDHRI